MAIRGKKGAAGKKAANAKVAKAGKAKKVVEEAEKEAEAEAAEAQEEPQKVEETAIAVAKDAPAEGTKGKKHKTKAHRIEEAVKKAELEEDSGDEDTAVKGVLYLGHIPFGFGEPQMRKYFNQFGTVLRLRLSRSKSNAASKGYAFIEFEEREVAKIVAQTMDGYMMFGKKLVCHVMDAEKVHPRLFKGWNRIMTNWTRMRNIQARQNYNDRPQVEMDGERVSRTTCQQVNRRQKENKKLQALLKELEVDYDLSAFSLPDSPKVKAALSPKLKAGAPPAPGKRKRDAAEAEEAAAELVAEDKVEAEAGKAAPASPGLSATSEKKARHRRRRGAPPVIADAKGAPKKKAASEAEPKKKAAKRK